MLDVTAAIGALFLAIFVSIRLIRDPGASRWEWIGTSSAATVIFAVSIVKAIRTRRDEMKFEPLKEPPTLLGWADGLHANLCRIQNCGPDSLGIRIVIYKVIWDRYGTKPEWLEQVVSYVGDRGGPPGRRISSRSGIVGRVARLAEICSAQRESADLDSFRDELVSLWGFMPQEAHDTSADRWSWFAVPLLEDDQKTTYGVIYLDSKRLDFFSDQRVQDAIVSASSIIARTLRMAYNRPR